MFGSFRPEEERKKQLVGGPAEVMSESGVLLGKKSKMMVSNRLCTPGVSKECFLEAFKYLKTSKQHPFETPGNYTFGGPSALLAASWSRLFAAKSAKRSA